MKVIFDARYIRTDFHDGISRYSTELGGALANLLPVTFLIYSEKQKAFLPDGADTIMFHPPTSWREPFSSLFLNHYEPDVVISPMQTLGSIGRNFKLILTVHDLIYYRHHTPPRNLPLPIRLGWRLYHLSYWPQRLALNSADVVMTVSETSRRDIMGAKLTERPIFVAPNAPQQLSNLLSSPPVHTTHPTELIYMGSSMPYKNVETLLRGMADLPGYTLHLLSRMPRRQRAHLEQLIPKNASVIFHNGVSDQEYAELLAKDALLVTASLDEGYGLPLAEAQAMGTPAVVSDIDIFHEVAGDGALYFAPTDPSAFAASVKQASERATYQRLSKKALSHSATFSWQRSATVLHTEIVQLASQQKTVPLADVE
jgi:glycosyltransferase involved in cell wall biosynthesis